MTILLKKGWVKNYPLLSVEYKFLAQLFELPESLWILQFFANFVVQTL